MRYHGRHGPLAKLVMSLMFFVFIVALGGGIGGCTTSAEKTESTLRKSGFTDIQTLGVATFACGERDLLGRKFSAKNAQGMAVDGVVCCGVLKGCTVRF